MITHLMYWVKSHKQAVKVKRLYHLYIMNYSHFITFDFYLKLISSSLMPSQLSYFSPSHALFNPPSYLHISFHSFLSFSPSINTPSFSFSFLYASLFKAFPLSFYSSSFPFLAYFLLLKTIPSCVFNILWKSTIMWLCVCVCACLWKALKQT